MNYYLESSACIHLFVEDQQKPELFDFLKLQLDDPETKVFVSWLTKLEVFRALGRLEASTDQAEEFFLGTNEIRLNAAVIRRARSQAPFTLKTLDTIHLATLLEYPMLELVLLSYDKQLLAAAKSKGIPTSSPSS